METLFAKLRLIIEDRDLRRRIFFVAAILVLFRLGAAVPIPGVDPLALERFLANNQFFGLLNIFSGGGLSSLSIMMLGVGPFITASIIMQLLTVVFPKLKELYHEEGEAGRRRMAQYSRLLTVPLALFQGLALLVVLERQGILPGLTVFDRMVSLAVVTAGALLLMWLGELINEYGIGNGISLLIFAGIVARVPSDTFQVLSTFDQTQVPVYLAFIAIAVAVIAGVVAMTEAERPIPVTYAKRIRGMKVYGGSSTYLPLRLTQAGVMPIIFALSLLLFPQMIANFLVTSSHTVLQSIAQTMVTILSNHWIYGSIYFFLVVLFTYFYSAVTFDPEQVADNLQKNGAFIPGVRPGLSTAEYVSRVLTRITLAGALFLGFVALLPIVMQGLTGISALAIGGTSLLIVVSVAIDFVKQVNAQVSMREY